jgi:hypothetical protein
MHAFSVVKTTALWEYAITGLLVLTLLGVLWLAIGLPPARLPASDRHVIDYY